MNIFGFAKGSANAEGTRSDGPPSSGVSPSRIPQLDRQAADVVFFSTGVDGTHVVTDYPINYEVHQLPPAPSGSSSSNSSTSGLSLRSPSSPSGGAASTASRLNEQVADFFAKQAGVSAKSISATHHYSGPLAKSQVGGSWVPHGKGRLVYRVFSTALPASHPISALGHGSELVGSVLSRANPFTGSSILGRVVAKGSTSGTSGSSSEHLHPAAGRARVGTVDDTGSRTFSPPLGGKLLGTPTTALGGFESQSPSRDCAGELTLLYCVFDGTFVRGKRHGRGTLAVLHKYVLICEWVDDEPSISTSPCALYFLSKSSTPVTVRLDCAGQPGAMCQPSHPTRSQAAGGAEGPSPSHTSGDTMLNVSNQYVGMVAMITTGMTTRTAFEGLHWVSQVRFVPDCAGEMLFHVDNTRYCGGWQCGQRHGFGVEHDPRTETVFMGAFQYDVRDGPGTLFNDKTGAVISGVWKSGQLSETANLFLPDQAASIQGAQWKNYNDLEFENGALRRTRGTLSGVWEPMFCDFDNVMIASALEVRDVIKYADVVVTMVQKPHFRNILALFQRCFYFQYATCPVTGSSAGLSTVAPSTGTDTLATATCSPQPLGAASGAACRNPEALGDESSAPPTEGTSGRTSDGSPSRPGIGAAGPVATSPSIRINSRAVDEHGLIATSPSLHVPPPTVHREYAHQLVPLATRRKRAQRRTGGMAIPPKGSGSGTPIQRAAQELPQHQSPCEESVCTGDEQVDGGVAALVHAMAALGRSSPCMRKLWVSPSWCEVVGLSGYCFHPQLSGWRPLRGAIKALQAPGSSLLSREHVLSKSVYGSALHGFASFVWSMRLRLLSFVASHPSACDLSVSKDVLRVCWDSLFSLVSPLLLDLVTSVHQREEAEFRLAIRRLGSRITIHDFVPDVPDRVDPVLLRVAAGTPSAVARSGLPTDANDGVSLIPTAVALDCLVDQWARLLCPPTRACDTPRRLEYTAWGPLIIYPEASTPADLLHVLHNTSNVAHLLAPPLAMWRERVFSYCAVAACQRVLERGPNGSVVPLSPAAYLRILLALTSDVSPPYPFGSFTDVRKHSRHPDLLNTTTTTAGRGRGSYTPSSPAANSPRASANHSQGGTSSCPSDEDSAAGVDDGAVPPPESSTCSSQHKADALRLVSQALDGVVRVRRMYAHTRDVYTGTLYPLDEIALRVRYLFMEAFHTSDLEADLFYTLPDALIALTLPTRVAYVRRHRAEWPLDNGSDGAAAASENQQAFEAPPIRYLLSIADVLKSSWEMLDPLRLRTADNVENAVSETILWIITCVGEVLMSAEPPAPSVTSTGRKASVPSQYPAAPRMPHTQPRLRAFKCPPVDGGAFAVDGDVDVLQYEWRRFVFVPNPCVKTKHVCEATTDSTAAWSSGRATANANSSIDAACVKADGTSSDVAASLSQIGTSALAGPSGGASPIDAPVSTAPAVPPASPLNKREVMQLTLLKAFAMRLGLSICVRSRYCRANDDDDDDDEGDTDGVGNDGANAAQHSGNGIAPTGSDTDGAAVVPSTTATPRQLGSRSDTDTALSTTPVPAATMSRAEAGPLSPSPQPHDLAMLPRLRQVRMAASSRAASDEDYSGIETVLELRCLDGFWRTAACEVLCDAWDGCRQLLQQTANMSNQRQATKQKRKP